MEDDSIETAEVDNIYRAKILVILQPYLQGQKCDIFITLHMWLIFIAQEI